MIFLNIIFLFSFYEFNILSNSVNETRTSLGLVPSCPETIPKSSNVLTRDWALFNPILNSLVILLIEATFSVTKNKQFQETFHLFRCSIINLTI